MSIRLTKPWVPLASLAPDDLPAQLGVFQLGGADGSVVHIGYAGGRTRFGLRTAVDAAVGSAAEAGWGPPVVIRWELTHGYLSRYHELLMVHVHDHGRAPVGNDEADLPGGRLTPVAAPTPVVEAGAVSNQNRGS